jgi:hypothetical protein
MVENSYGGMYSNPMNSINSSMTPMMGMMGYANGLIMPNESSGGSSFASMMVPPPMSNLPMQQGVSYVPLANKGDKGGGLGFQKNPVSKNRKKESK